MNFNLQLFGGRGGSSGGGGGGGGIGSGFNAPALWKKTKHSSMGDALSRANPNYFSRREFQTNCQRTAWAAELIRRGYSVEALEQMNDGLSRNKNYFRIVPGNENLEMTTTVRARSTDSALTKINKIMSDYGEGARAIIAVTWKDNNGGGHVFNLETTKGGKVVGYDTQNGRSDILREYISQAVTMPKHPIRQIRILRTDNLNLDYSKFNNVVKGK